MNLLRNQFEQTFSSNNQTQTLAKTFMTNVFSWMFIALGITAATAYLFPYLQIEPLGPEIQMLSYIDF